MSKKLIFVSVLLGLMMTTLSFYVFTEKYAKLYEDGKIYSMRKDGTIYSQDNSAVPGGLCAGGQLADEYDGQVYTKSGIPFKSSQITGQLGGCSTGTIDSMPSLLNSGWQFIANWFVWSLGIFLVVYGVKKLAHTRH